MIKDFPSLFCVTFVKNFIWYIRWICYKKYWENEEFEEAEKKIKEFILEFPSIKKELLLKLAENNLYANLAMLYDKNGNEEKANEYQQMIAETENEVPF